MASPDLAAVRARFTGPGGLFELTEEPVRGVSMSVFRHRLRSVQEVFRQSRRFGERIYTVDGSVRLSFDELHGLVGALATALVEEYRIEPGDRVALFAENRWEWVVSFWAAVAIGAIPTAMNGWWSADEFEAASRLVTPALLIGDPPRLERVAGLPMETPVLNLADDLPPLLRRYAGASVPEMVLAEDDPALLLFTSGTTGRSKAVTISHRGIVGFLQVNLSTEVLRKAAAGLPTPSAGDVLPPVDDVTLVTAPLFHTSMLLGSVVGAVERGRRIVLLGGRFDPERVLQTIEAEQVTSWSALGSAATRVATCPRLSEFDTSSVRVLAVGGAPVSPTVQAQLRSAFSASSVSLGMGYTSTEGVAVVASIGGAEYIANPTSTGRTTLTTEMELRDASGRAVADGEPGEVHVRTPYIMLGYWNDPEASAAVLKDGGWLAMGDIARFRDGLLHIDTRAGSMILVNAERVSPTEVEYILNEHPDVDEVAVFAVDDDLTGDAVCAVVHPVTGRSPEPVDLGQWCRGRLAHYKVPTRWHFADQPLPRTPSGKLVKAVLREWVETGAPLADTDG